MRGEHKVSYLIYDYTRERGDEISKLSLSVVSVQMTQMNISTTLEHNLF